MQNQTIINKIQKSSQKFAMNPQMSSIIRDDVVTDYIKRTKFFENQVQRPEIVELKRFNDENTDNDGHFSSQHEQHNPTHTEAMEVCHSTLQEILNHLLRTIEKYFFDRKVLELKSISPFQQLEELKLSKSQIDWKEMMLIKTESSHLIQLKTLLFSDNYQGDRGIMVHAEDKNSNKSLENLNLAGNYFGALEAKSLRYNLALRSIRQLFLSRNCSLKYIDKTLVESRLQTLILSDILFDCQEMEHLVPNKYWKNMKESRLKERVDSEIYFGCDKILDSSKHTFLNSCIVENLEYESIRHSRPQKRCVSETNKGVKSNETTDLTAEFARNGLKCTISIRDNDYSQLRGGGKKEDEEFKEKSMKDLNYKEVWKIMEKISRYKEKVQNDKDLNSELELYLEPTGEFIDADKNPETGPFELTYGIYKHLLSPNSALKVILLTGEAGAGKSLFCKQLQQVLLSELNNLSQELDERGWLPIYFDLSKFNYTKLSLSEFLTKLLIQELSLTEDEA